MIIAFILPFALLQVAWAATGFDATVPMSVDTFKCMKRNGYSFFIGRVWKSYGNYDFVGMQNIKNARAAGIKYVDGYIFPCLKSTCARAANQVEATIHKLREKGATIGELWLDIERFAWPKNKAHNRQFIRDMANKATSMGVKIGIYTSYYNWEEIVGLDWKEMSKYPLWWANYNGRQSWSHFKPFGGWSKPAMHQYKGDVRGPCGISDIDLNWW